MAGVRPSVAGVACHVVGAHHPVAGVTLCGWSGLPCGWGTISCSWESLPCWSTFLGDSPPCSWVSQPCGWGETLHSLIGLPCSWGHALPYGKGNALCGLLCGWHTLPCDNVPKEMNGLPCCKDNTHGGWGTLPSDSSANVQCSLPCDGSCATSGFQF